MKSVEALPVDSGLVSSAPISCGTSAAPEETVRTRTFTCRLCKALTKEIYVIYILVSAIICCFPGLLSSLTATKHVLPGWRLFLDLTVYEVVLVDVLCKKYLKLPRPLPPHRNGFPSGHATFSFALATLVSFMYPVLAPFWYGVAAAIAWSRYQLRAHFFYQVFCGALMGVILGFIVTWA